MKYQEILLYANKRRFQDQEFIGKIPKKTNKKWHKKLTYFGDLTAFSFHPLLIT